MQILQSFIDAFGAIEPIHLLWIILGLSAGVMVGALPGLNPSTGVAIMLPFTYSMYTAQAIVFLSALYFGATYGGSISAILIGVPGTTASAATVWDGHVMHKNGEGAKALGIAAIASCIGGLIGCVFLVVLTNELAEVALAFGAPEYFAICLFGLTIVSRLAGDNMAKALLSMLIGLVVAVVGQDPFWGVPRFTFGLNELTGGIDFLPVLIGAFALSQVMEIISDVKNYNTIYKTQAPKISKMFPKWEEFRGWLKTLSIASVIGTAIGVLPGAGATIASFICYNEGKRFSKHPEKFGKGYGEGIVACEAGNNAAAPGAIVPLLALGIPGSGTSALLLTAFIMHGLRPGPSLFISQTDLMNAIFGGCILANLLLIVVAILGIKIWSRIVSIPNNMLAIMIMFFAMMGSFSVEYSMFPVLIMVLSGILGCFMKKYHIPIAPMTLGLVLGYTLETNFRRTLVIGRGDLAAFFASPISAVFLILAILSVVSAVVPFKLKDLLKLFKRNKVKS